MWWVYNNGAGDRYTFGGHLSPAMLSMQSMLGDQCYEIYINAMQLMTGNLGFAI